MPDPNLPLPKAPILSYFTNTSSPTRVRILAARAVFWIALLNWVLATVILVQSILDIWGTARDFAGGPSVSFQDVLDALRYSLFYDNGFLEFSGLVLALAPALLLSIVSGPVRRGGRVAALLAFFYLMPLTVLITVTTASYGSLLLVMSLGIAGKAYPSYLVGFLLLPLPTLAILLLKDLCSFLRWIARQPAAEKPPPPFLPTRPTAHS
jgi:hypothetical protein